MMNETVKSSIKFLMWDVFYKFCCLLPQQENKVFYESFLGKSYSDNPKAMYEAFQKIGSYKAVWSINKKQNIPGNAKQVKRLGPRYFYHLATAKYVIVNSRMPMEYVKREGQIFVQTWHGTPLKKLAHDMQNFKMPNQTAETYLADFSKDIENWDYLLSQNAYATSKFKSAFKFEKEIIEMGYPRNDVLYKFDDLNVKMIKEKYQIKEDEQVLLYAPTYRDNQYDENNDYTQQIKLDLDLLNKRLKNWKIILRVHYLIAQKIECEYENIIISPIAADINEQLIIADCLLTDYSSIMFDYANLRRPMIFYAYDLAEYSTETRGFYQDYQKLICGESIRDTNALIKILKSFTNYQNRYKAEIDLFAEAYASNDNAAASEEVIKYLIGEK